MLCPYGSPSSFEPWNSAELVVHVTGRQTSPGSYQDTRLSKGSSFPITMHIYGVSPPPLLFSFLFLLLVSQRIHSQQVYKEVRIDGFGGRRVVTKPVWMGCRLPRFPPIQPDGAPQNHGTVNENKHLCDVRYMTGRKACKKRKTRLRIMGFQTTVLHTLNEVTVRQTDGFYYFLHIRLLDWDVVYSVSTRSISPCCQFRWNVRLTRWLLIITLHTTRSGGHDR